MNTFSAAGRWFSATQVLDRRRRDPQVSRRKRRARSRAYAAMLEPLEDRIVLNVHGSLDHGRHLRPTPGKREKH